MKLAYFIMVHHKPYQFEWLFNAIYNTDDIFLIHIDLKTFTGLKRDRRGTANRIQQIIKDRPNVSLMKPNYTNWGGWSLSKVMLKAMDHLLDKDSDWTHFINLSGQCYPLKSADAIKSHINYNSKLEHVELRHFSGLPSDDWHLRWIPMFETPVRAFMLPGARKPPAKFEMEYKGAQWVILTRAFCDWQRSAGIVSDIRDYLRHSLLSDELIWQTLLRNGPFKDKVADHYGRTIIWPGPKVMTMNDLDMLRQERGLFGRKFDAAIDVDVLFKLAESGGYYAGPNVTG